MINDDGFNKFVQNFDQKLKINKKTKTPHESFTEKYRYYKEFLKNFKDRKERSCSRQRQSKKNLYRDLCLKILKKFIEKEF